MVIFQQLQQYANSSSSKALLLGDPTFPSFFTYRRGRDRIKLFQQLFSSYSELALTNPTDRPVAISGLIDRLSETFQMTATHGIFDGYVHRSLIWYRCVKEKTRPISYPANQRVSSWSWMAFAGKISYMDIKYYNVEWNQSVQLKNGQLSAEVRELQPLRCQRRGDGLFGIRKVKGKGKRGWWNIDCIERAAKPRLACIIVGRSKDLDTDQAYYVLIVDAKDLHTHKTVERVGIGFVPGDCISFDIEAVPATVL